MLKVLKIPLFVQLALSLFSTECKDCSSLTDARFQLVYSQRVKPKKNTNIKKWKWIQKKNTWKQKQNGNGVPRNGNGN